jgi:hypothetical protein
MNEELPMVDATWFTTMEDATQRLAPGDAYDQLTRRFFTSNPSGEIRMNQLVLLALLVRMNGLHQGTLRELANDNPHAVWPLMRAYFELEVAMLYISRHPQYLMSLAEKPSGDNLGAPALPKMTTMLRAVKDVIPAGADAYRQLSDIAHPGVLATWSGHTVSLNDDGSLLLQWSPHPRFRPEQLPIAAAQLEELILGTQGTFIKLAEHHLAVVPESQ